MPRFRKKPVVIEAVQFVFEKPPLAEDMGPPPEGLMFMQWVVQKDDKGVFLVIPVLGEARRADLGDWIITTGKGEQYPCKPDIFEATYEPHGEDPTKNTRRWWWASLFITLPDEIDEQDAREIMVESLQTRAAAMKPEDIALGRCPAHSRMSIMAPGERKVKFTSGAVR